MSTTNLHLVSDADPSEAFYEDLRACLQDPAHAISPKYFYDAAGSALFEQICALPEYYLTRTELEIFAEHMPEMAEQIGPGAEIIEFGAGSLSKIRLLLDALQTPSRFVAIDISGEHLKAALETLRADYPGLEMQALVEDFTRVETLPVWHAGGRRVGFFPGSTIGNFNRDEARHFLATAARLLRGGGLLIGVDLLKDPNLLHAAYNDAAGITAAFNRNLLVRANAELGCNFDIDAFTHYAFYNPTEGRMEMHLVNQRRQTICLREQCFILEAGEAIHTENSYKYSVAGFEALARQSGFSPTQLWTDTLQRFGVFWLESGD